MIGYLYGDNNVESTNRNIDEAQYQENFCFSALIFPTLVSASLNIMERNQSKVDFYKNIFTFCFIPECNFFIEECHHIIPIGSGGIDEFKNFFPLCYKHHRNAKMHSDWIIKEPELLTYKFYKELSILEFTSDIPDDIFKQKIRELRQIFKLKSFESIEKFKIKNSPIKKEPILLVEEHIPSVKKHIPSIKKSKQKEIVSFDAKIRQETFSIIEYEGSNVKTNVKIEQQMKERGYRLINYQSDNGTTRFFFKRTRIG